MAVNLVLEVLLVAVEGISILVVNARGGVAILRDLCCGFHS